jgi:hypothetical protein
VVLSETGDVPQELHHVTVEAGTKFAPVTVTVTGLEVPATAPVGETEETVGPLIVKFRVFEETRLTESVTAIVAVPGVVNRVEGIAAVIEVDELAVTLRAVV